MGWIPVRFRAELRALASHEDGQPPSDEAIDRASAEFEARGQHDGGQLVAALERARELDRDPLEGAPPLRTTLLYERLKNQWKATIEGRAHHARELAFKQRDPPWTAEQYAEAVQWIEDRFAEQEARYPGRRADPNFAEVEDPELLRQLGSVASKLARRTGVPFAAGFNRRELEFLARSETGEWEPRRILTRDGRWSPLGSLAEASQELSQALGIELWEATRYLLIGGELPLRRATVSGGTRFLWTTTESQVPAPYVEIRLYTPDITNSDMRTIRREADRMWRHLLHDEPEARNKPRRAEGARLTEGDSRFLKVAERMGGIPPSPDQAFWERMLQGWREVDPSPEPIKPDTLRTRYRRLREKADSLGIRIPMQRVDAG